MAPSSARWPALLLLASSPALSGLSSCAPATPRSQGRSEAPATDPGDPELLFWIENARRHGFTPEETAEATGLPPDEARRMLARRDLEKSATGSDPRDVLEVLPYPGGRHPRIGFLEGAIDPHRDTKVSVFLPWEGAGYVVVDLPEALWTDLGLTYLAHTHIPTIWDARGVRLERLDWKRRRGGVLESRRELPNGIEIAARAVPRKDALDMELRVKNGTSTKLTDLRAQVCVLLKGAPGFDAQTNDNKLLLEGASAVRSEDGRRWIATFWDRSRSWANPPCPCLHADPTFPDLEPGEEATARGTLFVHEGAGVEAEIARRREARREEREGKEETADKQAGETSRAREARQRGRAPRGA